jgi:hypothetical protein
MTTDFEQELAEMDERRFKALTGLSKQEFHKLLPTFAESHTEIQQENYAKNKTKRQRRPGAGQKGRLDTMRKKLFFVLYYLKNYPTFDTLGDRFALDRSKACTNAHKLTPVLCRALDKLGVLPQRKFNSVEEMEAVLAHIEELFIDATERPHQRPQDDHEQREKYSGKKKQHTVKNTVISNARRVILFLGYTACGHQHDYGLFKSEFPPELDWFKAFKVWVDLGYVGFQGDYAALEINIPHKKPRKSKTNPDPQLTTEQKEENRHVSSIRVVVEHAIGGLKRFNILVAKFRNRTADFDDDVALVSAGLWNWKLSLQNIT